MSVIKKGASAFGKLFTVIALAGTFVVGAVGVVYMSLQGEEMKVPEIVGKDLNESEKELASLGLRVKKRADRYSTEKPNTILEQLPKAGDTVKTGQMILVVTSKTNAEGGETPVTIKKDTNQQEKEDSEKIEELISDKPKKKAVANTNANANKKKGSTTRDVIGGNSNGNSNSNTSNSNNNSGETGSDKSNKNTGGNSNKSNSNSNSNKSNSNSTKPPANKAAATTGGDLRPRRTP